MKKSTALTFSIGFAAVLLGSGCQFIGGGVAGAGYDSIWTVNAAKAEPAYISARLSEERVDHHDPYQHLKVEELVRDFPSVIPKLSSRSAIIPGTDMEALYNRYKLEIYSENRRIIDDNLPKVFYMHGPVLGMGRLGHESVLIICARSRATTGLNFIAIYSAEGEMLLREIIPVGNLQRIRYDNHSIELISHDSIRRLKFSPERKARKTEPNHRLQTMRFTLPMNAIARGPHV